MKRLDVNVCVCTHCVMNGALEIAESVKSLQKLKNQLRFDTTVRVNATENLCKTANADASPLVIVGGEVIEKATSDAVMAKIISKISRG